MKSIALIALFVFLSMTASYAQNRSSNTSRTADIVRSNYTKFEYHVPMRDGVKLYTSVYAPKDASRQYPILLLRTPYSVGPYGSNSYRGSLGPSDTFAREGFIFVYQDVRGRFESEGEFIDEPPHKAHLEGPKDIDPSTDTYDTIDWLIKNIPNNNGRVGTWGVSYPGFYSAYGLINSHPALKAVSPQAPMGDVGNGDDVYHNGAFFLAANFGFFTGFWPRGPTLQESRSRDRFEFGTEDEYDFYLRMGPLSNAEDLCFKHKNHYWSDMLEHPNYDEFWASRALGPNMHHLTAPVLLVGGWFDAEDLGGTLKLFRAIEADGSAPALTLVMGPWSHGQWSRGGAEKLGNLSFGSKTGEYFRDKIEFPFFMHALKDEGDGKLPKAWLFETGKNEWRQFEVWPPKNATRRSLYLEAGGKLSFTPPSGSAEEFDEYTSDPAKPVPVTSEIGEGMPGDYMTYDQRFASRRTDVLTYQTEPLNHDVTIAGPITPVLRVSTSGTDSDFMVKLIDVYPNDHPDPDPNPKGVRFGGYQQMVRGEPFRGKFRNSMSRPEPFIPGQPAKIEFAMPDVLHTFEAGHRIMVQIQSSWFPLVDRNPQHFEDIPKAKAADFQKAVERVYHGGAEGTRVDVLVTE
jgi:putative CocE/NonD family hydrolase